MSYEYPEERVSGLPSPEIQGIAANVLQRRAQQMMQDRLPAAIHGVDIHAGPLANAAWVSDVNRDALKQMGRARTLNGVHFGPSLVECAVHAVTNLARRVLRRTR